MKIRWLENMTYRLAKGMRSKKTDRTGEHKGVGSKLTSVLRKMNTKPMRSKLMSVSFSISDTMNANWGAFVFRARWKLTDALQSCEHLYFKRAPGWRETDTFRKTDERLYMFRSFPRATEGRSCVSPPDLIIILCSNGLGAPVISP
jgi:hypothetical protein